MWFVLKVIIYLVFILLLSSNKIFAQDIELPTDTLKARISDNRIRINYGLLNPYDKEKDGLSLHFINLSYRHSELPFDYIEHNFGFGFSFEAGLNFLVNPETKIPYFSFIMGYFKGGPEFRLFKNVYTDIHAGLTGIVLASEGFGAVPFVGLDIGYGIKAFDMINLEIEIGGNLAVGGFFPLVYFMFGISF